MEQPDISQLELNEPNVNHDEYDVGGFTPPPPARTPDGKAIVYWGQAPQEITFGPTKGNYLMAEIDPVTVVDATVPLPNGGVQGYEIRYTRASATPFTIRRGPKKGQKLNASMLGNYLRSHGIALSGTPTNEDLVAATRATTGRNFPFLLDWEAYDKDRKVTVVEGYANFPNDPDNPGWKLPFIEKDGKRFWAQARIARFVDQVTP